MLLAELADLVEEQAVSGGLSFDLQGVEPIVESMPARDALFPPTNSCEPLLLVYSMRLQTSSQAEVFQSAYLAGSKGPTMTGISAAAVAAGNTPARTVPAAVKATAAAIGRSTVAAQALRTVAAEAAASAAMAVVDAAAEVSTAVTAACASAATTGNREGLEDGSCEEEAIKISDEEADIVMADTEDRSNESDQAAEEVKAKSGSASHVAEAGACSQARSSAGICHSPGLMAQTVSGSIQSVHKQSLHVSGKPPSLSGVLSGFGSGSGHGPAPSCKLQLQVGTV